MGLFDLFSSGNEKAASELQRSGLDKGWNRFAKFSGKGLNEFTNYNNMAYNEYDKLNQLGDQGISAYGNALGLNGAAGSQSALQGFQQQNPGYGFAMDQGLDALDRRAASRGMLNSGNTSADTLRFSQGLADQNWQQYIANLANTVGVAQNTAGAQAGIRQGQGQGNLATRLVQADTANQREVGKANATANYQLSKDQTGANVLGAAGLASKIIGGLF